MSTATYALPTRLPLLLRDMGVATPRVLRRAGLPADRLSHAGPRVPAATFYRLWQGLVDEVGAAQLPVLVASSVTAETFDPAVFASLCSPDLNHAARRLAHHKPLCGPIRLCVEQDAHATRLVFRWPADCPPPPTFGQTELLWWIALARMATRTTVRPLEMVGPSPADFSEYAGVAIEAGPEWSVRFSAMDAARPFLTANDAMWAFFEPELRRRLDAVTASATTEDRVRSLLLELLPTGDVAMTTVARRLCTSTRTLQRRLAAEQTSFQALLATTRAALARHYLTESQLPAAEISFLLGYADPNSFYRAFHAWTGQTPDAVRARAAG